MSNTGPGYWPGQNNSCDVKGCSGAGSPKHIDHVLRDMTVTQLMGRILSHCGDNITPIKSCMCCHYAREIGLRGDTQAFTRGRYYKGEE